LDNIKSAGLRKMCVLSLSYWESDVTITNISQSLPHIMAGKTAGIDTVMKKLRHWHPMYICDTISMAVTGLFDVAVLTN